MVKTDYKRITVEPASGSLGAVIGGVNLARPLDDETFAEIRRAFTEYSVIYFHDQDITPEQQCDFARRFGPLTRHPFVKTMPDNPYVAPLIREADATGMSFGATWHMDVTFMECPPLGSTLYAVEPSAAGGDTMFSSMYKAYATLSEGLRALADQLIVIHSAAKSYDPDVADKKQQEMVHQKGMAFDLNMQEIRKEMEHPLVRIHPESGRKLLFVTNGYMVRFKGMTEEESKPLFDFFLNHAARPEFTCRFRYRKGTLGMWDNRCVQHFAVNDYQGYRREMHRVQIGGDRPYGPAMPKQQTASAIRATG